MYSMSKNTLDDTKIYKVVFLVILEILLEVILYMENDEESGSKNRHCHKGTFICLTFEECCG